jgi:RNA polymerase sigma factor (TIGR02999 family)
MTSAAISILENRICVSMYGVPRTSDMESQSEVTALLHAWGAGDRGVEDSLFAILLPELRRIAKHLMRRERPDHSLQTTALLNEAYLRLVNQREREWQGRQHFLAFAARAMRHLLIDHARGRREGRKLQLDELEGLLPSGQKHLDLAISIDRLLHEMEASHPDWCVVVEMKFFAGFTDDEASEALGMPVRTLQRKFGDARRWLFERMEPPNGKR